MDELEIFLSDLTLEAQTRILKFLKIKTAQEGNFDVFPLFVLTQAQVVSMKSVKSSESQTKA